MESIKKNFIYQSLYQVLTIIYPMITAPYISRVVGAEGIGIYSFTYSIASYFVLFAKLGIHVYGNRSIASVRDDKEKLNQVFCDLYALHFILSLISIIAYYGYIFIFVKDYKFIALIQGLYVIGQLFDINWFYFGMEKFKLTVVRNSLIKLLTLCCIFVFVKTNTDIWKYVSILAVGYFISESAVWFLVPRYIKYVKPNWSNVKKHLYPMISFFIPSVAVSLYKVMDKIMLGLMSTTTQVGYYENSEKIIYIVLGFVTSLGTIMMPRMSNLVAKGNKDESMKMIDKSIKFIMIISSAMTFGIISISSVFATVFFGPEFSQCDTLIIVLSLSLPLTAFANVLRTQYLIPNHKDKIFILSVIMGAVVNIIINIILIPHYQALGTVIGTVCAEGAVCIIQAIAVKKELPIKKYIYSSAPFYFIGFVMMVMVYPIGLFMGIKISTLVIQVFVGVIVFCTLTLIYLYTKGDEILYQLKILNCINRKTSNKNI